ncbi:MAG TPA: DUF1697 domain-containing protein [Solirubrobacteraceae bacterium]|nr:DUF1697 domain-containing protein [Solirubrobacteraceae bacterium]
MAHNTSQILLLRGINVGSNKRIAMPELRALLTDAGFEDVQTYVQSGNVVLSSGLPPDEAAARAQQLIASRFGFEVDVIARTADELAEVVRANPLADVADNPKRFQVSFCDGEPDVAAVEKIVAAAAPDERLVAIGRELYAWHPDGVGRSKMFAKLTGSGLGVRATARNWTTVTKLLEMAQEG